METEFIYLDEFYKKKIKIITWIVFSVFLLIDAAALLLYILYPAYWGVELFGAILFTVLNVIYVLLNGLFYADRFCYKITDEYVHVRRSIATEKDAVYRLESVKRISVRKYKIFKRESYFIKFYTQCGSFRLSFLSKETAQQSLVRFRGLYDESIFAE